MRFDRSFLPVNREKKKLGFPGGNTLAVGRPSCPDQTGQEPQAKRF